jgi:putative hydrolase of the HAD superfamily
MLTCLLFDLDNTLYSCRWGLEDNVRRRMKEFCAAYLGLSPDEIWRQRMEQQHKYGTTLEWLMNDKGFTDVEAYLAAVHPKGEADNLEPDPELRAFLAGLPLPKAILTNAPGEHAELILGKLGITGLFTHIIDIRQNGFKGKPHPETFNRALGILRHKAEDVLFIDDNPSYVQGFIALGGQGLLLDENNIHRDYPHAKIRELRELAAFMPQRC